MVANNIFKQKIDKAAYSFISEMHHIGIIIKTDIHEEISEPKSGNITTYKNMFPMS